jgi:hypothetical protein
VASIGENADDRPVNRTQYEEDCYAAVELLVVLRIENPGKSRGIYKSTIVSL